MGCEFCGRGVKNWYGQDPALCGACKLIPFELRGQLLAVLQDLRSQGVRAFIRVEVGEETPTP